MSTEGQYDWSTKRFVYTVHFQCVLTLTGVLFKDKFGYSEVTSLHSCEHCGIGVHVEMAV